MWVLLSYQTKIDFSTKVPGFLLTCVSPAAGRSAIYQGKHREDLSGKAQPHQIRGVLERAPLHTGEVCGYPGWSVAWREQSRTVDDPDKSIISL